MGFDEIARGCSALGVALSFDDSKVAHLMYRGKVDEVSSAEALSEPGLSMGEFILMRAVELKTYADRKATA